MRKKAPEVLLAFKGSEIREAFAPPGGRSIRSRPASACTLTWAIVEVPGTLQEEGVARDLGSAPT